MLTFDPSNHSYRFSGRPVPSVTQLLQHLHSFEGVPHDVLEAAKERGTAVHLTTELFDKDDLVEDTLDPVLTGYLKGWRQFKADHKARFVGIEKRVYHPTFRYAGTYDRKGYLDGGPEVWRLDIKTSIQSHPVWGLQTAAYERADNPLPGDRRGTVQLRPDGTYRFHEWTDAADWPTFVSLASLHHWTQKHAK